MDEAAVDKLVALLDYMVVEAGGQYEVTVDMFMRFAPPTLSICEDVMSPLGKVMSRAGRGRCLSMLGP